MQRSLLARFSVLALFAAQTAFIAEAQETITKAEASISADRLREQDKFVSDDLFEGRYPGLRGGQLAATYIASQFAQYGLKPAGDNGTFLQQVNFVGMKAEAEKTSLTLQPAKGQPVLLKFGADYTASNQTLTPSTHLDAPIVFVGYGVTAPEFNWNDYAGVDVKGKVILCIVGDPPSDDPKFFGGRALTYYGRWTYKFEQAARMGAVGALIIHRTDLASYGWNVVENSNTSEKTYLRDDANPRLQDASWIQLEVARQIFAMSGMDLDREFSAAGMKGFRAVELPVKLSATVVSTVRPFQSPNVVGILPGEITSPDQAVMYTAHYDHLGTKPGAPGDNIYNGAADNGLGTSLLLELARTWSLAVQNGLKLPHSVIFGSVTAEEQGLLGSEYLGQHPPIPASQIALDINYDMPLAFGIPQELNLNGSQRTTFYPEIQAEAKKFGFTLVPDPRPEAGSYYRSDHFSLSRVGIPAFSVDLGPKYEGHDAAWGVAKEKTFNDDCYHNFCDNFDPSWNFEGQAKIARFGMDVGWLALHQPKTIEWVRGDEFEAARKKSEGK